MVTYLNDQERKVPSTDRLQDRPSLNHFKNGIYLLGGMGCLVLPAQSPVELGLVNGTVLDDKHLGGGVGAATPGHVLAELLVAGRGVEGGHLVTGKGLWAGYQCSVGQCGRQGETGRTCARCRCK
jgi:hypothetical protein